MNATSKGVTALLAALLLSWAPAVYAADNGTEFGIEDDLTVLGTEGTAPDPDAEVKGFTVFGATQAAYTGISAAAGNVVVNGHLSVSSGAYFVGGSTFAAGGAYFTGVSSFSDVSNIHIAGGAAGQVLKKVAGGGMVWGNDVEGAGEIAGTPRRLVMFQADGTGGSDSQFQQDADDAGITMISGSSLTIKGAFRADGAVSLGNTLGVTGAATLNDALTVQGATLLNGNVGLGNAAGDLVTINGQSSFVAGSTFAAGAYFQSVSSFSNAANVHVAGGAEGQVLSKAAGGGMQWSSVSDMVSGDNLGNHTATTTLQMQNHEIMNAGHVTASSMTLTETLAAAGAVDFDTTLNVDGASTLRGNNQLGDAITDGHAINQAPEANVALAVKGTATSGQYITKFYSDTSLAAWIKKK